jgi:uncharacterized protein
MRILHVSDLHFRQRWFDWVAAQATRFDAVCLSGDLLDMLPTARTNLREQAKWATQWLAAFPGERLFVCSGNHDWWAAEGTDRDAEGKWLMRARRRNVVVDGDVRILEGMRFVCSPWLRPVEADGLEPVVLIVHAPPEGAAVAKDRSGMDVGDFEVAQIAQQLPPHSLVLSGHAHTPARWFARIGGVCCFNPGVDFESKSVPNHIVIDTERRRAEFYGWARSMGPVRL